MKVRTIAGCLLLALIIVGFWMSDRRPEPTTATNPVPACGVTSSTDLPRRHPGLPPPTSASIDSVSRVELPTDTVVTNAADLYRQAFAELEGLSDEELQILLGSDDAASAELCDKLAAAVAKAHEATTITNCDWAIVMDGPEANLVKVFPPARRMAKALLWNAAHCHGGDATGVTADVQAALQLGESVSVFLIGHLVNSAVQNMVTDFLAARGGKLSPTDATAIAALFEDPRYESLFYRAIEKEVDVTNAMVSQLEATQWEEMRESFDTMELLMEMEVEDLKKLTKEQFIAATREYAELQLELIAKIAKSDAEYQLWLGKVKALEQTNPVVKLNWPALEGTIERTRLQIVKRAMVVAGLNLLQVGTGVLAQYPDPATGQPFIYRETKTGFQLESAFRYQEKPVTLKFVR